jgi:hypothetical protein
VFIERNAGGLGSHPRVARRIVGEQLFQVQALHAWHMVILERRP